MSAALASILSWLTALCLEHSHMCLLQDLSLQVNSYFVLPLLFFLFFNLKTMQALLWSEVSTLRQDLHKFKVLHMLPRVVMFISMNIGHPVALADRWGSCGDTSCFFCSSTQITQDGKGFGGLKTLAWGSRMNCACGCCFFGVILASGSYFSISKACLDHSLILEA